MIPARHEGSDWWRSSVIYQLYVKSFADSDGDGIGDLDGIRDRLDYLADLGVDGLWLNPCYPSPNRDGGYDVADYLAVDDRYGGMAAFDRLVAAAHERGLRVLMDLVPNHCSDEHPWFVEALHAPAGSAPRSRFHFADGLGPDGSQPPNNWLSTFGGPAWSRLPDGQWYLHSFDPSQPDFNWANPDVGAMFEKVVATWFDRGVDGLRIDVAYAMVKAPGLPDADDPTAHNPHMWNQPGVHAIFRRWRAIADGYQPPRTLLGEVWLPPADAAAYIRPGELNQVFYFDLLQQDFDAAAFRRSIEQTLDGLAGAEGVPTWTLNSHDVHRSVSRYGLVEPEPTSSADANATRTRARGRVDVRLGVRRATAAMLLLLALPGSVYLYQGEELGLPEVQDLPDNARQDPIWERSGHTEYGRDGCRVPLPWAAAEPAFGFTDGRPWLPQPSWFAEFAVDTQLAAGDSVLHRYRAALAARRLIDPVTPLEWLATEREDVLAFRRGAIVCVTVFGAAAFHVPDGWGRPVIASSGAGTKTLMADMTGWYEI